MRGSARGSPQLSSQYNFSRYETSHKEALPEPRMHNYTACSCCVKAFPHSMPRATLKAHLSQRNHPSYSNILHQQLLRRRDMDLPKVSFCAAAKNPTCWVLSSFASTC